MHANDKSMIKRIGDNHSALFTIVYLALSRCERETTQVCDRCVLLERAVQTRLLTGVERGFHRAPRSRVSPAE